MTLTTILVVSLLTLAPAAAKTGTCPEWEPMLQKYGLPVADFSYVMWRESRCLSSAVGHNKNARDDIGLLQVSASWSTLTKRLCRTTKRPEVALLSPTCNLTVAASLYSTSGLRPWKTTTRKKQTK
jgi:hypothetical protein